MAEGVDHWLLMGCFQPETLSKSTLTEILKKRNIYKSLVEHLDVVDNEQLCSFYHRFLMPQPQRKYGNNRRGRRMSKRQSSRGKRKIPDSCTSLIGKEGSKKFAPNSTQDSTGFNLKNQTKPNKILSPSSKGMKSEDSTRKNNNLTTANENDYDKDSKRRKITWP